MTKRICINTLCLVLVLSMCVIVFAGCGGKNYSYVDFQNAYTDYVAKNTLSQSNVNSIFDSNGNVSVNYANTKLLSAISANSVDDYVLMFTRLSSDASSSQAIFEPALQSSFLMISKYVSNTPQKAIPSDRVNALIEKLANLNSKTDSFTFNLIKFQTRGDKFDKTNGIDKSFLKNLLDSYYDLLVASSALAVEFADVVNLYFWADIANSSSGRLAPGKIERYYLTQLVNLTDVYVRFDLATFYSQAYKIDGVEYYTNQRPAEGINTMLTEYNSNVQALVDFENKYNAGEMSDEEKNVVQSFYNATNYDATYISAYNNASKSLSRIDNITSNLDEKFDANSASQAHKRIVENFVKNEFHNKINSQINIFKAVENLI